MVRRNLTMTRSACTAGRLSAWAPGGRSSRGGERRVRFSPGPENETRADGQEARYMGAVIRGHIFRDAA
jgi:hypothetical protein